MKKVVFLDRDGVINRDSPNYIKSRDEFEFLPGSINAIKNLTLNGYTVIIITNQSAINRGITPLRELEHIHSMMTETLKSHGAEIKDIFFCPHTPEHGCGCRKPEPGMIKKAQEKYRIDLADSCMVGDSAKDIECGQRAGCGYTVLVKTGNGITAQKILEEKNIFPDYVAGDLYDAVQWILQKSNSNDL
ncbi:MAG: D-glycero-beta-D-manno-heptose 1,7-bisphosphate 7-phosphatase [Desulfobacteraceae bacterium]|nr:D-glycero-beta-D-manno-heptose 1,7-bisphosphate 7-phosphatase [Desulfobacteraceae bacterium]